MNASEAIGVFDSGVGGLSVLRAVRAALPAEDLMYVADSAHVPYGDKPEHFIEARAIAVSEFLLSQGAKAIVVACNTATSAAIVALRARFAAPIIGMEPAVKPAACTTRSGVVGVLATSGTLASGKFAGLLHRFGDKAEVCVQACAGLVERVEAGDIASDATRALLASYVIPLVRDGADTLVLGCTHYPFLTPLIQAIAGPEVAILDPSPAVARELKRRLEEHGLMTTTDRPGATTFWTSGTPSVVRPVISMLWAGDVEVRPLPASVRTPAASVNGSAASDRTSR